MPTFINESVLSLPEQVEKNKNDIKAIEETIGGIDPTLVSQVETNKNDISAIKQEQTVQNTAINNNTNKTQNINANGTEYSNVEEIKNENGVLQIKGNGISIENDDATEIITPNANINVNNSGVVKISNDNNTNKLEYDGANGSFKVSGGHTLEFDSATGDLKIDGGAVGGGELYRHRVTLGTNLGYTCKFVVYSTSNTVMNTQNVGSVLNIFNFIRIPAIITRTLEGVKTLIANEVIINRNGTFSYDYLGPNLEYGGELSFPVSTFTDSVDAV